VNTVIEKPEPVRAIGDAVERPFLRVVFQRGFPKEVGINGCRVEDVIDLAIDRLQRYQRGPLACEENAQALHALEQANRVLHDRMRRREEQGVLNTMSRHVYNRTEDDHDDFSATGS
jgi:hypothetical protein